MTGSRGDTPDFSDPPVAEHVLSVQFAPLPNIHVAHMGLFWNEIKGRFPKSEERSELPAIVEQFPEIPRHGTGVQIQFQTFEVPPVPRCWFVNNDGTELIQLQKDRFIKNWRQAGTEAEYPRYERVKAGFEEDFEIFRRFAKKENLGEIHVNQCEVTYINHIVAGEVWTEHSDMDKVFTSWRQPEFDFPGKAADAGWTARFMIPDNNNPVGRLHVNVQPSTRVQDGRRMFVMSLTARGQIGTEIDFFDLGRQWVVRSFKNLTTAEMHRVWGLRN